MCENRIICFDIGGTKIAQSVINVDGENFKFLSHDIAENPKNSREIKKLLLRFCLLSKNKFNTTKVAVSCAKIVDQNMKKVKQAESIFGDKFFDFYFLIKHGFEVRMENDGRCFGLGEYYFGMGKGVENLLTLTFGTGIGGGFLLNGRSLQGFNFSAMEVSYIYFFSQEMNKIVNWQSISGGCGIAEAFNKKWGLNKNTEEIFKLAYKRNKKALEFVRLSKITNGLILANLVNIFDPELIILGGSMVKQKKFFDDSMKLAKSHFCNKNRLYKWKISKLNERANLLGAASLFMNKDYE